MIFHSYANDLLRFIFLQIYIDNLFCGNRLKVKGGKENKKDVEESVKAGLSKENVLC